MKIVFALMFLVFMFSCSSDIKSSKYYDRYKDGNDYYARFKPENDYYERFK